MNPSEQIINPEYNDNFFRWYEGSVLCYEDGSPLIFYHKSRSNKVFSEFRLTDVVKGIDKTCHGYFFVERSKKGDIEWIADGIEVYAFLKMLKPFYIYDNNGHPSDQDRNSLGAIVINKPYVDSLISRGFDGIIIVGGYNQYVVFNEKQIKSVNNSGAYNPDTADIYN